MNIEEKRLNERFELLKRMLDGTADIFKSDSVLSMLNRIFTCDCPACPMPKDDNDWDAIHQRAVTAMTVYMAANRDFYGSLVQFAHRVWTGAITNEEAVVIVDELSGTIEWLTAFELALGVHGRMMKNGHPKNGASKHWELLQGLAKLRWQLMQLHAPGNDDIKETIDSYKAAMKQRAAKGGS